MKYLHLLWASKTFFGTVFVSEENQLKNIIFFLFRKKALAKPVNKK